MKRKVVKRDWNADLIRCVAAFSVICVHFFLNIDFYNQIFIGKRMFFGMILRTVFMICVPMFIILTGYLMKEKTLSKNYYKGIIRTLEVYVIASIFCLLFRIFYLNQDYTFIEAMFRIFDYETSGYAWYIEMYIGLFLLIPFLNILWNNLKDKKQKHWLILTLIVLTTLPSLLNIFDIGTFGHKLNGRYYQAQKIVPTFFYDIYPITYYFIGSYLKENKFNLSVKKLICIFIYFVILFGVFNFYTNYGGAFDYGIYADWGSYQNMIISIVMFMILLKVKLDKPKKWVQFILLNISKLSLGIYLLSYIPDRIIYPKLLKQVSSPIMTLEYFIIVVIAVFSISTLLSILVEIIIKLLNRISKWLYQLLKRKDLSQNT